MIISFPQEKPWCLIISGPTASGKTSLSYEIARRIPVEIINADVGQFYRPFTIGTAKPAWQESNIQHHLFDILQSPKDFTVVEFRAHVLDLIENITRRGAIPLIVGGSLFYLKSLFYPPRSTFIDDIHPSFVDTAMRGSDAYQELERIDPLRARALHPHDTYRIKRALVIWQSTGKRPSECLPTYNSFLRGVFIFLHPDRQTLNKRIHERTNTMLYKGGWIDEVVSLQGTAWVSFLKKKGLIGYSALIDWLEQGKKTALDTVALSIAHETCHYAKRQITFWKGFKKKLEKEKDSDLFVKEYISSQRSSDIIDEVMKSLSVHALKP